MCIYTHLTAVDNEKTHKKAKEKLKKESSIFLCVFYALVRIDENENFIYFNV